MDISSTLPEPRAFDAGLRHPGNEPAAGALTRASWLDNMRLMLRVIVPTIAKGVIIRRPRALALAERLDLDRRAVQEVQRLRDRYGTQPLLMRLPGRPRALILDPDDVHRVLEQTPEPFSTATPEKRAALSHFEPRGALISKGPERTVRRRLNEAALQSTEPVHSLGERFALIVEEEVAPLMARARRVGGLAWDDFAPAWFRMVRRVVFGESAAEDHALSHAVYELRRRANWAFLLPDRPALREELLGRIRHYIAKGEPSSLAGVIARLHPPAAAAPEHQVPQWLFAFDPAGMAAFRTLALLATHPAHAESVREEVAGGGLHLPMLRALVLESLRLWPTTPLILRDTVAETHWGGRALPAGSGVLIYAPFFHRDEAHLPGANRLQPQLWLAERSTRDWPLVPFSSGPAVCPARHLVLMLTSLFLAQMLRRADFRLESGQRLDPARPLPGTLAHTGLRFRTLRPDARR